MSQLKELPQQICDICDALSYYWACDTKHGSNDGGKGFGDLVACFYGWIVVLLELCERLIPPVVHHLVQIDLHFLMRIHVNSIVMITIKRVTTKICMLAMGA